MKLARFATKPFRNLVGIFCLVFAVASLALSAHAQVANPTVTGPIPARDALGAKTHDYPWFTT